MPVIEITSENYQKEVLESDKPVLIDFWASWCGPCKMLSPVINEIAGEVTSTKICKVDIDKQPELASRFKVMSIPTLVLIKNGEVAATSVGAKPKEAIIDMIS